MAPFTLAVAAACLLLAMVVVFLQPGLLRLSGPLVCPSGYDHSEAHHFPEPDGDETTHLPSLRCYGPSGEVLAERVSAQLTIPIVALWLGMIGVVAVGLPVWIARRRRQRQSQRQSQH